MTTVSIIGSGISSLSSACYLAQKGYKVRVYEKNNYLGGRARQLHKDGFLFDMGPTFYWMPDVFDDFFKDFGKKSSDYYDLEKLSPAYRVYVNDHHYIDISDKTSEIINTFETIESGSGKKLQKFLNQAQDNYELAIQDLVYQPGEKVFEIINTKTASKLNLFLKTISQDVKKVVKNPFLRQILEFPVLFLGAKPSNTPSFYNFMNHADFNLGTWHPKGGMYKVVEAMVSLGRELGVEYHIDSSVGDIEIDATGKAKGVFINNEFIPSDIVLSGADYAHTETLLPQKFRQYKTAYWEKKTFAPSALLFYVAFSEKIPNVKHHTLFFDTDFEKHAEEIYDTKEWPKSPLFYASFPSKSDDALAPEGKESGVFLIPIATDLEDTEDIRNQYFELICERLSKQTNSDIKSKILFKESFCVKDFKSDYNSFGGNAYGLANTLLQTHVLRPKLKSKKVKNLYFTGQLTVPGPGVPPAIISGNIVSDLIAKYHPTKQP
jgi:phytoene desaturase